VTRLRPLPAAAALLSVGLAVIAVWLMLDNPTIDRTSRGDDYPCLASYDTAVNDADNIPGGETPPDGEEIAARCREAGTARFAQGATAGTAAAVLAAYWARPSRR
jgi:hypothetical protein